MGRTGARAGVRGAVLASALGFGFGFVAACGKGDGGGAARGEGSSGGTRAESADVMACLPVARCNEWGGYGRGYCAALRTDGTLVLPGAVRATPEPARVCPGDAEAAPELQACMDYVETQRECARRPRVGVPGFQCVRVQGGCEARGG